MRKKEGGKRGKYCKARPAPRREEGDKKREPPCPPLIVISMAWTRAQIFQMSYDLDKIIRIILTNCIISLSIVMNFLSCSKHRGQEIFDLKFNSQIFTYWEKFTDWQRLRSRHCFKHPLRSVAVIVSMIERTTFFPNTTSFGLHIVKYNSNTIKNTEDMWKIILMYLHCRTSRHDDQQHEPKNF